MTADTAERRKWRKKPVVIEARRFNSPLIYDQTLLANWCGGHLRGVKLPPEERCILIPTLEGEIEASFGDWIICGVKGEFYPCKPDIFAATYDPVEEARASAPAGAPDGWLTVEAPPRGFKLTYVPDYPEGAVVGPCICGSWPGGQCLRCPIKDDPNHPTILSAAPAPPAEGEGVRVEPCIGLGWKCDGEYHRGWDGNDPWCERCPRPDPYLKVARIILGEVCACYAEAWPGETCDEEARKLSVRLRELFQLALEPVPAQVEEERDPSLAKHPDDIAVDGFAKVMSAKLASKRALGYGGWDDKERCSAEHLSNLMRKHVEKGDPVDVANFAMMLHQRGERIVPEPAPAQAEEIERLTKERDEARTQTSAVAKDRASRKAERDAAMGLLFRFIEWAETHTPNEPGIAEIKLALVALQSGGDEG